jgi:hypothetical protein
MHISTDRSYDGYYEAGDVLQRVGWKKMGRQRVNDTCCFFDCRKFGSLVTSKQIWLMQSKLHEPFGTFRVK